MTGDARALAPCSWCGRRLAGRGALARRRPTRWGNCRCDLREEGGGGLFVCRAGRGCAGRRAPTRRPGAARTSRSSTTTRCATIAFGLRCARRRRRGRTRGAGDPAGAARLCGPGRRASTAVKASAATVLGAPWPPTGSTTCASRSPTAPSPPNAGRPPRHRASDPVRIVRSGRPAPSSRRLAGRGARRRHGEPVRPARGADPRGGRRARPRPAGREVRGPWGAALRWHPVTTPARCRRAHLRRTAPRGRLRAAGVAADEPRLPSCVCPPSSSPGAWATRGSSAPRARRADRRTRRTARPGGASTPMPPSTPPRSSIGCGGGLAEQGASGRRGGGAGGGGGSGLRGGRGLRERGHECAHRARGVDAAAHHAPRGCSARGPKSGCITHCRGCRRCSGTGGAHPRDRRRAVARRAAATGSVGGSA